MANFNFEFRGDIEMPSGGLSGEMEGEFHFGIQGKPGKSAYQYAKEAGYGGTEEEFGIALAKAAAGNGGVVDETAVKKIVEDYLKENPPAAGQPGITPHIGDNGNWFIGDTDTGVKASGKDGEDGQDGLTPHIGNNGNWFIGDTDTGTKATGEDGQRGTGLLPITTAPSTYTTAVNGLTPAYRIALSKVKSEASVSEVLAGDTLRYSYYHYPVIYVDSSYVYCRTRVSIRGSQGDPGNPGTDGKSAYQYALDGGYTGTEEEFAQKLATDGYVVAQPEPPENTNVLWFDTDDNSEDEPESGGSAPADWNAAEGEPGHVLNRTHYEAISKICEEVIIDSTSYDTIITLLSPLSAGEAYTVRWGEEAYNCTCSEFMGVTCLGNQSPMGGEDTGEPFFIAGTGNNGQVMGLGGDGDIEFSIVGKVTVKIPEKYLPVFPKVNTVIVTDEEMESMSDDIVTMNQSYDEFIDSLWAGGIVQMQYQATVFRALSAAWVPSSAMGEESSLILECRVFENTAFKSICFVFRGMKVPPISLN